MVDNINIKKTISPTSFTSRIKKVDRQDADAQQRPFDSQLEEEDEKNKQATHAFESTEIGDSKETGKEPAETDNREDRDSDNTQGKLIDILV